MQLSGSTRDEEPLVDAWVNWGRSKVLVFGNRRKLIRADTTWRVLDAQIGDGDVTGLGLASYQSFPSFGALTDDIGSVFLVFALASKGELVLRLSIWDLVYSEPLICCPQETRKMSLNILDVVELRCQWVVDINHNDLPISFLLVEQSHDTKDLDLLDLSWVTNKLADFADVQWVVVALGLGLWVNNIGILPCLWESTIVPEVTLVGEAVSDEAKLALFDILLDWVEKLFLGYLNEGKSQ